MAHYASVVWLLADDDLSLQYLWCWLWSIKRRSYFATRVVLLPTSDNLSLQYLWCWLRPVNRGRFLRKLRCQTSGVLFLSYDFLSLQDFWHRLRPIGFWRRQRSSWIRHSNRLQLFLQSRTLKV